MGSIHLGLKKMSEKSGWVELLVQRVRQWTSRRKSIVVAHVGWVVIGTAFVISRQQQSSGHSTTQALDKRWLISTAVRFCQNE
jgi:hypothetical protein